MSESEPEPDPRPREGCTAILYLDGERFVYRDHQVDELLARAAEADTIEAAWETARVYGHEIEEEEEKDG